MATFRVDIPGLDLVLGGGIPAVRRADDLEESATLLVRGPPGSGKSIFGAQLAVALARTLVCDVAYACVELLPHELRAQREAFGRTDERIVLPPFATQEPRRQRGVCTFAATLDMGDPKNERDKIGGALLELLEVVNGCGGAPRVLVIDSLSDGYGLGASAPRELADGVCKMAAQLGMFVVLLEETTDGRPTSWSFATDIVFELEAPRAGASRSMTVVKNRFGPSDPGPHELTIEPLHGVRLFPRPSCYLAPWAKVLEGPPSPTPSQPWGIPVKELPPFQASTTAVYGSNAALVFDVVNTLGKVNQGVDLFVDFARQGTGAFDREPGSTIYAGDPFLTGNRLVGEVVSSLRGLHRSRLDRVIVGDFRSLRTFSDPDGIRRSVGVLVALLRRAGIPAVLFETTAGPSSSAASIAMERMQPLPAMTRFEMHSEEPPIVDFADVLIELVVGSPHAQAIVTDVRARKQFIWDDVPLPQRRAAPSS